MSFLDLIPDVRDGLTRRQRIVLYVLHQAQAEMGDRSVPTVMLWGRVNEFVHMDEGELVAILRMFGAGQR